MSEKLKNKIAYHLDTAQEVIERFAEKLARDPAVAFAWSEEALRASATLQVWQAIDSEFRQGTALEEITSCVQRSALQAAQDATSSTSPMVNEFERWRRIALAVAAQELRVMAEHEVKDTVREVVTSVAGDRRPALQ